MSKLHNVKEMIYENRADAANILASLIEGADRYGSVSVADYYDTIGESSCYTDNNYGWSLENITKARIELYTSKYVRAYKIVFPPVEDLDSKVKVESIACVTPKKSITISVENGDIEINNNMNMYEAIGLLNIVLQRYQTQAVKDISENN